jgi:proline iminopeptidase
VLISTAPSYDFMAEANAIAAERASLEQQRVLPTIFDGTIRTADNWRHWWDVMLPLYFYRYDQAIGDAMLGRGIGNPEITRYMFEHELPHYDVRPRLGMIGVPTLIISGRHDWITPPTQGAEIHGLMPGSVFTVFEHSGHMPFIEEQDAFLDVVRRFLTPVAARAAPALANATS